MNNFILILTYVQCLQWNDYSDSRKTHQENQISNKSNEADDHGHQSSLAHMRWLLSKVVWAKMPICSLYNAKQNKNLLVRYSLTLKLYSQYLH